MARGNMVVGQSGGPTSVINASLAGVLDGATAASEVDRVLGMRFGIEGLMEERLVDLTGAGPDAVEGLQRTPGAALGSSRYKLRDEDLPRVLRVLRANDVRHFLMAGGNDTMDTVERVERYCRDGGYDLVGVGVPKTVDNDLYGTDHTPGFPSAARCNVLNVAQAGILARDMQRVDQFVVYQTVGRDAGWLAAATVMARRDPDDAPHLVYLPERPFDPDRFLAEAKDCYDAHGWVSIVCGEGLKDASGRPVSAGDGDDAFGNTEFGAMGGGSVAFRLHRMLTEAFGWRGEFQITESLIMAAADRAEPADVAEAFACGREAVAVAVAGESGRMVTIERVSDDPYAVRYGTAPLAEVAVRARPMPDEFVGDAGAGPTRAFVDYCAPLLSPLPEAVRLAAADA